MNVGDLVRMTADLLARHRASGIDVTLYSGVGRVVELEESIHYGRWARVAFGVWTTHLSYWAHCDDLVEVAS